MSEYDDSLTDSARRTLETYLNIERQKILERARISAIHRTHGGSEIGSADIIESLSNFSTELDVERRKEVLNYRTERRSRLIQITQLYGLTLLTIGSFMAIYFQFRNAIEPTTAYSLAIAAAGGVIAVALPRMIRVTFSPDARTRIADMDTKPPAPSIETEDHIAVARRAIYLSVWNELEGVVRLVSQQRDPNKDFAIGLRGIISNLVESGELAIEDAEVFFEALRLRNRLVHEIDSPKDEDYILSMLAAMEHLKYHLESLL